MSHIQIQILQPLKDIVKEQMTFQDEISVDREEHEMQYWIGERNLVLR